MMERCGEDMKFKEMFFSYLKRRWWYLVLLISSTIFVLYCRNNINQLKEFNVMNLIFIIWLVLLILPLFSEMEFFGIKLKKEVEKAKAEVNDNLNDLRMQIMDLKILNSNSNANTINVRNDFLPSEQKLKDLLKEFITNSSPSVYNSSEAKSPRNRDTSTETGVPINIDFDIDEETVYLFKIRLFLEKILTNLCEKTSYNQHKSIFEMIQHLNRCEIINGKTVDLISQIIKIATRGVHGEIVSKEYIGFIKRVFPELQKQLNQANEKLHYCICPRCKYAGYSRFENVCPMCGFTSDN